MPRRGHTEEAMLHTRRQAEGGETVAEICRKRGVSEPTFYAWKRKYAGMGLSEHNESRPHRALQDRTPVEFARSIRMGCHPEGLKTAGDSP